MDIAMREWLTVIIVLLIVGIVLDGLRRMRQSRKNNIRMSLSMQSGKGREDVDGYGSELPSGRARVIYRDENDAAQLNEAVRHPYSAGSAGRTASQKPYRIPEQVRLNLDESVPMLMESVEETEREEPEPSLEEKRNERIEPRLTEEPVDEFDQLTPPEPSRPEPVRAQQAQTSKTEPSPVPRPKPASSARGAAPAKSGRREERQQVSAREAGEVLVINVMAPKGYYFSGAGLLEVVLSCGMRFGAMDIFHCHEDDQGEGEVLFSMANIVVPGTFDLHSMEEFQTPGVSLFLTLPLRADSQRAFNRMVATASVLCEQLGGELKDENRSVMTRQTIEHCRQRILDFERKRLSRTSA